jgi:hypothetical protein
MKESLPNEVLPIKFGQALLSASHPYAGWRTDLRIPYIMNLLEEVCGKLPEDGSAMLAVID